MSKRKRDRDEEQTKPDDAPAKEEVFVADPPQPNASFLAVTAGLYLVWLAFLVWMSLSR